MNNIVVVTEKDSVKQFMGIKYLFKLHEFSVKCEDVILWICKQTKRAYKNVCGCKTCKGLDELRKKRAEISWETYAKQMWVILHSALADCLLETWTGWQPLERSLDKPLSERTVYCLYVLIRKPISSPHLLQMGPLEGRSSDTLLSEETVNSFGVFMS